MRTLDGAIDLLAARGDAVAFRRRTDFRSFPVTGREAAARALRIAAALRRAGVGRGDRVVVRAPNGPDWGLSLLAILRLGAVAVPLDARASLEFTARIAGKTAAKAAVVSLHGAPAPAGLATLVVEDYDARLGPADGPDPPPAGLDPSAVAEILFTSGTTGAPKGVVLTHGNIASNVVALSRLARLGTGDAFLSLLPLSHMFEQSVGFFLPILQGCRVVYLDTLKPSAVVHALDEERISVAVVVPRLLKGLMQGVERAAAGGARGAIFRAAFGAAPAMPGWLRRVAFGAVHRRFGGRVRFFLSGGAPLEPDVEEFWERLGFPVVQGYGLTETSPVLACARPAARRRGSVGMFLDGVERRFGEGGELEVRGPGVFAGYHEDPERTAGVLRDGWFRTGDLAEERDGFLYLKGRSKDLIKTPGGLNVYPEDVEAALRRSEGVRDACVFGLRGPAGEEVVAALVAQPGARLDPRAAAAAANALLEEGRGVARAFAWPGEDFPRTSTLKVRRFQVKEAVAAMAAGGAAAAEAAAAAAPGSADPVIDALARLARRDAAEIEGSLRLGADLGLDSLDLVDLVSRLEQALNLDLDESEVTPATTVDALRALLARRAGAADDRLPRWPRGALASAFRACFRGLLLFPLFRAFVRLEVVGAERLAGIEGPLVLAPNHLSHLDCPAVFLALPPARRRRTAAAAWQEYFEPEGAGLAKRAWLALLQRTLMAGLPLVPVSQSKGFRRSLRSVGTMLDEGWSVLFFPEGERSRSGERAAFKAGIGVVATAMGATVVPVRLEGFHLLLPRDGFLPRRGGGRVIFGEPRRFRRDEDPAAVTLALERAVDALGGPGGR
jgi:long-chain acyl-CoA synthetase